MPAKKQHFVPRAYLKSWESAVYGKQEPTKPFKGVYIFGKSEQGIGDGITTKKILCENHTYTIDFDYTFILPYCPEIKKDFAAKIRSVLDERNTEVRMNGRLLTSDDDIGNNLYLLEQWEFYNRADGKQGPKIALTNRIMHLHSFVLEDAFSKLVENEWERILLEFIGPAESLPKGRGQIDYHLSTPQISHDMIRMFAYMALRNPAFDMFGIIPELRKVLTTQFSGCNDQERHEITEEYIRGLWLSEIYKGLFKVKSGFFFTIVPNAIARGGLVIFKVRDDSEGCFITSDNPAFFHMSSVMSRNYNGLYFPLTPQYMLFIGLNTAYEISDLVIKTIGNKDIRTINWIILNSATEHLISNQQNLDYIL